MEHLHLMPCAALGLGRNLQLRLHTTTVAQAPGELRRFGATVQIVMSKAKNFHFSRPPPGAAKGVGQVGRLPTPSSTSRNLVPLARPQSTHAGRSRKEAYG